MSFITSVRRAFGIGADATDFEEYSDDEAAPVVTQPPHTVEAQTVRQPADDSLPADILTAVIELFNTQQPEFVRNCLNTDAQKQYLLNAIDADVRSRIEAAIKRAHEIGRQQFEQQRRNLAEEISLLRRQKQELEQRREESKNEKLSAERQKRALNERVHDLESQVQTLEADKEQYMLENRSMLNKLRVAQVTGALPGGELPDMEEIDNLRNQLETAQKQIEELKVVGEHANVKARKKSEQLKQQQQECEQLKQKVVELERQVEGAAGNAARTDAEIKRLQSEIVERDSMITELQESRNAAANRNDDLCREVDSAKAREKELNAEIETLRATIAENLRSNAELMAEMPTVSSDPVTKFTINPDMMLVKPDDEPDEVDSVSEVPAELPTDGKHRKRRRGRPRGSKNKKRISAIDELMDSSDWLVAPSPETVQPIVDARKNDDFGYQEPPRKQVDETDRRQLSLF
ncbi:MAG: hypothetical protein NC131_13695 [Roseburia sp.]|nr:hypothetical protein [Roseburia sp.]